MTRSTVMSPRQLSQWCKAELARHERQQHHADLDHAAGQMSKAHENRDSDRYWFWSAVRSRVQRGENLTAAMHAEHRGHGGPYRAELRFGHPAPVEALDYWTL